MEIGFTMPSDTLMGSLLRTLVATKRVGNFLELGTGIGLSLAWMADGLSIDGRLTSVDNEYLKNHPDCNGKAGIVGFCFGGRVSNMMAARIPALNAAVPFYGGQPSDEEAAQIKSPLLRDWMKG